jgi:hypothetical protein
MAMFAVPAVMFAHLVVGVQLVRDVDYSHSVAVVVQRAVVHGVEHPAGHVAEVVVHDVFAPNWKVHVVPHDYEVVVAHVDKVVVNVGAGVVHHVSPVVEFASV